MSQPTNYTKSKIAVPSREVVEDHIQSMFLDGMTWSNSHLWSIKQAIRITPEDNPFEVEALLHYTNLRPVWN
jgi:hypothetical protein